MYSQFSRTTYEAPCSKVKLKLVIFSKRLLQFLFYVYLYCNIKKFTEGFVLVQSLVEGNGIEQKEVELSWMFKLCDVSGLSVRKPSDLISVVAYLVPSHG